MPWDLKNRIPRRKLRIQSYFARVSPDPTSEGPCVFQLQYNKFRRSSIIVSLGVPSMFSKRTMVESPSAVELLI